MQITPITNKYLVRAYHFTWNCIMPHKLLRRAHCFVLSFKVDSALETQKTVTPLLELKMGNYFNCALKHKEATFLITLCIESKHQALVSILEASLATTKQQGQNVKLVR